MNGLQMNFKAVRIPLIVLANPKKMIMFLKAIFAFYFLAEIISTTALEPINKFKRETQDLVKTLNGTCDIIKDGPCGNQRVREIKLEPAVEQNSTLLCTTYQNMFCHVNRALKELNGNICRNTNMTFIQRASKLLKENAKCHSSNNFIVHMTFKEFCPKLRSYIEMLYNICTKQ